MNTLTVIPCLKNSHYNIWTKYICFHIHGCFNMFLVSYLGVITGLEGNPLFEVKQPIGAGQIPVIANSDTGLSPQFDNS